MTTSNEIPTPSDRQWNIDHICHIPPHFLRYKGTPEVRARARVSPVAGVGILQCTESSAEKNLGENI